MDKEVLTTMNNSLKKKLTLLPQKPGVYKFLDEKGKILYIGKAINLRARVNSYFAKELYDRPRIKQMVPHIEDVQVVETNNEVESLVLESVLIKEHQPFYNSDKKDDKSYVWIYISTKEKFPTVKIVRKINNEEYKKGQLFGPYPSSTATKRIFTYLRKIYPFCTCKKEQSKECLYFHLDLCPGPHQGHISKEEYRKNINEIVKFLRGRKRGQITEMEKKMQIYSKKKEYEEAAKLRDRINDLKYLGEQIDFLPEDTEKSYKERRKQLLSKQFEEIKSELNIDKLERIECYDISNIQGKQAYGSMVVAENGEIRREQYRIFKIDDTKQANDPAMLKRVLERRFDEKNLHKYDKLPDIILIDGGVSQLSILIPLFEKVIPKNIHLLGISKGKRLKRSGARQVDEFWIVLNNESEIKRVEIKNREILIDLRDEAHRFAILHHRKARRRDSTISTLENIPGVGQRRRNLLLKHFKNVENIKRASVEEINKVVKNKKVSKDIHSFLN